MEHQEFWQKIESSLRNYEQAYTPMRWFRHWGGLTRGRRGHFIFLRFVFLVGLYVAAYYLPLSAWAKISLTIIASLSDSRYVHVAHFHRLWRSSAHAAAAGPGFSLL